MHLILAKLASCTLTLGKLMPHTLILGKLAPYTLIPGKEWWCRLSARTTTPYPGARSHDRKLRIGFANSDLTDT
ncbi:hypothetical protein KSC_047680 [Ktedonobacter sp. SOSP1-52]|nr:hypothetical protein KSC_047680 [Ktedonobacter sp. SOSP1-52]